MKLTRRELPAVLGAALPLPATQPPQEQESPAELLKAASERTRRTAETIAKVAVPMDIEPAFAFRAQDNG